MADTTLEVKDAVNWLSSALLDSTENAENPYMHYSFGQFFFEVYVKSFPDPKIAGKYLDFDTWHIHLLIADIEHAFENGKNLVFVLPRLHLKSTMLYAIAIWRMLTIRNCKILYLSYKDGMAKYHMAEIKRIVKDKPYLSRIMKDRSSRSEATIRYEIDGIGVAKILSGGVLSFKRGTHVNGACFADDILRDPQNPLNLSQLLVVDRHINNEIRFIPNKGVPLILAGTPMHAQDILLKLKDDVEYTWRFLPAIRPGPEDLVKIWPENTEVLWPKVYDKQWLDAMSKSDWMSFQTEFLLTPAMEVAAFFTRQELSHVLDANLFNFSISTPYPWDEDDDEDMFAGYDVGKKRHPSHLAIFLRKKKGNLIMVHSSFHDGVDYAIQAQRITDAIENFRIREMMIDNTRGEMDERGLPPQARLMTMTSKLKKELATIFSRYVSERKIMMIDELRFVSQLVAVSSDLQAPESPMGHGESFTSADRKSVV